VIPITAEPKLIERIEASCTHASVCVSFESEQKNAPGEPGAFCD